MKTLGLLAALLLALPVQAWEVGEFKNGMPRAEVEQALKTWNFDKTLPVGNDGLIAYDLPNNPAGRRFLFTFCNDKLVSFDQEIEPAFRHFVVQIGEGRDPIIAAGANGLKNALLLGPDAKAMDRSLGSFGFAKHA